MKIYKLVQGTPDWHNFRLTHRGASEAAVMLGISPKATRTELLHMKHTGIAKEFSDWVQEKILDHGHEVEAMARPIIEDQIADDLYPVTCGEDEGLLSASCDGLPMSRELAWEHKQWNAALAASVAAGILPDEFQPQCQQIMMVTPAQKVIFTVSDGTEENMVSMEVFPDAEWQKRIRAGWAQFEEELANFVPVEKTVKAVAAPQFGLPAVSIQVNGSIALIDNLQAFGTALTAYVEKINLKPETDQDFADLEATVKTLKNAEDALDAAESGALAQTESIDAMRRTVAMYRDTARTNRLFIDKMVKAEKENRRAAIVRDAGASLANHINGLSIRIQQNLPSIASDFPGVVKGLKSIDSMRDKVATELARCKIEANAIADKMAANLKEIDAQEGFGFLFYDRAALALKDPEFVAMAIKNRIADHQAKEAARIAAETARIAEQERAKAQARADAEIAAATAKAQAEAQANAYEQARTYAEAQRASDDAIAKAQAEHPAVVAAVAQFDEDVRVMLTHNPAQVAPTGGGDITPTMRLGQISERLGFAVTAVFLSELGFEPCATDKSAKLYKARLFPLICRELVKHINHVSDLQAA